jgi:MoaA/NifB/PqqE/SkfB family radical SAM enzyme
MFLANPKSKRENIFKRTYDSDRYRNVLNNRSAPADFPFMVDVEPTNHCNLTCSCCVQQVMKRKKGFMETSLFKKIIDECAAHSAPVRLIRLGEPFLHKDILKFCRYAKEKGVGLHITNNGLALQESDMKALIDMELDSVIFSFQGATKEGYELMRNNDRYDQLVSNITKLVELRGERMKPYIHISSTMTDESRNEIKGFMERWAGVADSVGVGKTSMAQLSESQMRSMEAMGKVRMLKERETVRKTYSPCTEVYQKLSVDWDGKVTCCCGDYDNFMVVGDANVTSLSDIWNNSAELKRFRRILDNNMHKTLPLCSACYHTYEEF